MLSDSDDGEKPLTEDHAIYCEGCATAKPARLVDQCVYCGGNFCGECRHDAAKHDTCCDPSKDVDVPATA